MGERLGCVACGRPSTLKPVAVAVPSVGPHPITSTPYLTQQGPTARSLAFVNLLPLGSFWVRGIGVHGATTALMQGVYSQLRHGPFTFRHSAAGRPPATHATIFWPSRLTRKGTIELTIMDLGPGQRGLLCTYLEGAYFCICKARPLLLQLKGLGYHRRWGPKLVEMLGSVTAERGSGVRGFGGRISNQWPWLSVDSRHRLDTPDF